MLAFTYYRHVVASVTCTCHRGFPLACLVGMLIFLNGLLGCNSYAPHVDRGLARQNELTLPPNSPLANDNTVIRYQYQPPAGSSPPPNSPPPPWTTPPATNRPAISPVQYTAPSGPIPPGGVANPPYGYGGPPTPYAAPVPQPVYPGPVVSPPAYPMTPPTASYGVPYAVPNAIPGAPPPGSVMLAPPGSPGSFLSNDNRFADVVVNVEETETGRFMIGAAVNSDAGVTGQIIVDEKNFNWQRFPTSWDDVVSGRAFRGAGQSFRLEALPGSQFHRYSFTFSEPYLAQTQLSLTLNGFLYSRNFLDWDEERIGGRVGLGYRVTEDLSLKLDLRAEQVELSNPRVSGVAELDAALGESDLFGAGLSLIKDTRDIPFAPSQGYMLQLSFEQVFGDFDFPRGELSYQRHFLIAERPDGSGRHVLTFWNRFGLTGDDTPVFENFFAGGYSTLRGFSFRGASPRNQGIIVGGELQMLGSVEYLFPITADDMVKGVVFVDYGTVEEELKVESDDYRVALGAGLRLNIPAMGPAPLAFDFAVPVARDDTDDIQTFSFFVGFSR
jgi:outer membrane protein insertion porin family